MDGIVIIRTTCRDQRSDVRPLTSVLRFLLQSSSRLIYFLKLKLT
jgi:hypothetical protein